MESIFEKIALAEKERTALAVCTVVATTGSTPRKQGAKMLVYSDGSLFGSVGGGSIEKQVVDKALEMIPQGISGKFVFALEEDLHMHCGGKMEVFIEPLLLPAQLIIFGAGHIGKALAKISAELGFLITLVDHRIESYDNFRLLRMDYFEAIETLNFDDNTYIVIVTHNHEFDERILAKVAFKPNAYIGMIGSKTKVALLKKRFVEEKILSIKQLEQIDMPIGLKFAAETPAEIAVSIVAKLIDVRNTIRK